MRAKKLLTWFYGKSEKIVSDSGLGKYKAVQSGGRLLRSHLKSAQVEINGNKMFLDENDSLKLSTTGKYEEFETTTLSKIIKKGDVVVDVGANIGYYTLIFAKLVGNTGKVYAFEPDLANFNLLKKNVEINKYENIFLINKAVSNSNGKIDLFLNKQNKGSHSIFSNNNNLPRIEIETIRLDDFFKDREEKVGFIKIDIEGAELEALKGMSSILKNNNVKLMSEFNPPLLKKFKINPEEYLQILKDFCFKIYHLDDNEEKIRPIILSEFLKKFTPEKKLYTNLLCSKNNDFLNSTLQQ